MKKLLWLSLWIGLFAANSFAAVIQFRVNDLGGSLHSYEYFVSGLTLQANQAIDIRFDPALYDTLSDGVVGSGFKLVLVQPNNPPGATGDYRAVALADNPSFAGPFGVNFTFVGNGTPGSQAFLINQYTAAGIFVSTIESGVTTLLPQTTIPEPATFAFGCAALLLGGIVKTIRRK